VSYSYFIWYRVGDDTRETETVIRHMMARLACRAGISGRLLTKRGEPRLWMELYEGVSDPNTFERLLASAVDEFDVDMFCEDRRHTECFDQDAEAETACRVP